MLSLSLTTQHIAIVDAAPRRFEGVTSVLEATFVTTTNDFVLQGMANLAAHTGADSLSRIIPGALQRGPSAAVDRRRCWSLAGRGRNTTARRT